LIWSSIACSPGWKVRVVCGRNEYDLLISAVSPGAIVRVAILRDLRAERAAGLAEVQAEVDGGPCGLRPVDTITGRGLRERVDIVRDALLADMPDA
jgi:hypothetical protein